MRSFWLDPYLWVHLAGVAVVPIALEGCLLGLAASNSLLPPWIELLLVGSIGAAPILWMQWQRPFCIYSLMFLALQPRKLTEEQRRILRRFQSPVGRGLSLVTAGVLLAALWQIYQIAPIAWESASVVPGGALGGLLLASISFLFANLFLQVPVSVAQVMLTDERTIAATEPYPVNAVARDFTLFGIRVNQILPSLKTEPVLATAGASVPPQTADRRGDRPAKTAPTRFKDPQPTGGNSRTPATANPAGQSNPAAQSAAQSTGQTAPKPKRPVVPVEVIDAEFRELDTDDEWDEVIVSEEESLTDKSQPEVFAEKLAEKSTEAATPAVGAIQAGISYIEPIVPSESTDPSESTSPEIDSPEIISAETIAPAGTEINIAPGIASDTDSQANSQTDLQIDSLADSQADSQIDSLADSQINSQAETVTIAALTPDPIALESEQETIVDLPESSAPEFTDELAEPFLPPEPSPEPSSEISPLAEPLSSSEMPEVVTEELLQPIPEPIEELPERTQTSFSGDEDLLISAMTLIESEDVSEAAAVDIPAVEVVTAEIVEDVSEDAAVPAETIETWLEEDWEEEVTG